MSDAPIFIDRETIRLTKDGVFLSDGEEIAHVRTAQAFHRFLGHDETGYFIQIGRDFKRIEVEDTAYFVTGIEWSGGTEIESVTLRLNDETREVLAPKTLKYQLDRLTCRVKSGKEEAKFLRQPYTELLMRALSEGDGYAIRISGETIKLG